MKIYTLLSICVIVLFALSPAVTFATIHRDTSFNPIAPSSIVLSITQQSDGKILIGGGFTDYDGQSNLDRLARLNTDGTRDTAFNHTGFNSTVNALVVLPDGKILVGGAFTDYDGSVDADRIVRLNADGTRDAVFSPIVFNGTITTLTYLSDGKIVVGGNFTNYDGQDNLDYIAQLNSDGTRDTTFNPVAFASGSSLQTIEFQSDNKILVGGSFLDYDGQAHLDNVARLNSDGTRDTTFNPVAFGAIVRSIAYQSDGKILVGGSFLDYDGQTHLDNVARLNSDGTRDTSFNPVALSSSVFSLLLESDGRIIIGGVFTNYDGQDNLDYIARLNSDGTRDALFNPIGFSASIRKLFKQTDGKLVVGGSFLDYDGQANLDRIARINVDYTNPTLVTITPTSSAVDVPITSNITFQFSEGIRYGTTSDPIQIYKQSDDTLVESIPLLDARISTTSTSTVVIDLQTDLLPNTTYYSIVPNTFIQDYYENLYEGLIASSSYTFTTLAESSSSESSGNVNAVTSRLTYSSGFSSWTETPSGIIYRHNESNVLTPMHLITKDLVYRMTDDQVKVLQRILNKNKNTAVAYKGIGSTEKETTYFGPATLKAVQTFQLLNGIVSSPKESGYGRVGPKTRRALHEVGL